MLSKQHILASSVYLIRYSYLNVYSMIITLINDKMDTARKLLVILIEVVNFGLKA